MHRHTMALADRTFPLLPHTMMVTGINNQSEDFQDVDADLITAFNQSGTSSALTIKAQADLNDPNEDISDDIEEAFYRDFSKDPLGIYDFESFECWANRFSINFSFNTLTTNNHLADGELSIDILLTNQMHRLYGRGSLDRSGIGSYVFT